MKKLFTIVLSILMGVFAFAGCSGAKQSAEPAVSDILDRLEQAVTIPQSTRFEDADTICTMYDLDTAMVAEMGMLKAGNGANADEIMLIKVNDAKDISVIKEVYNQRLTVLKELFADYTPEDMPKIENAAIETSGSYIMLAVCDDPYAAVDAFTASFKTN